MLYLSLANLLLHSISYHSEWWRRNGRNRQDCACSHKGYNPPVMVAPHSDPALITPGHFIFDPVNLERVAGIQRSLSAWYCANKRELPWRGADPYGVWVSEIMLQQTQVATVIPYYERFIQRFPNVAALASASQDDVLQFWAGLGYYARARNLHRAAGMIVERFAGQVPNRLEDMLTLPGIGDYTAGAILSIAYNQRYAAIDANANSSVMPRSCGISGDPKSGACKLEDLP